MIFSNLINLINRGLSIWTFWMLWPCSKASKVSFESIKINIWKHQKQQGIKFDALLTLFWENINFPVKLWLNELRIRKHCFSLSFSDGFNTTHISASVVKQDEINPSFFWSKIIFDAFKKYLRQGKFWQERKKKP